MSGIFKGKMGKEGLEKGASYKSGSGGVSCKAAGELVERFLALDLIMMHFRTTEEKIYGELTAQATAIIEPYNTEEFNPQGFLGTAVHLLAESGEPVFWVDVRAEPDYLIEPMLQALYNLGHNSLIVDPMHLPYPPTDMASYLHGEPGNPLAFSYNGPVGWLGNNARHCRIKTGGYVKVLGKDAEDSTFYVKARIRRWTASPEELKDEMEDIIYLPLGFFDKGNKLFVPGGESGWKELTVEDGMGGLWRRLIKR